MEKIALKDFLKEQEKQPVLCVIQSEKSSLNKVTLTRWRESKKRCDFSQSVTVDMGLIDFIHPTEHTCFRGEKKYTVVEVIFKQNATVPLTDLLDAVWRTSTLDDELESVFHYI